MNQSQAIAILKTGANVFLTGEPGSGKTHTVNAYVAYLRARGIEPAITASTGIAATHIGGLTIHSWSGIGIKSQLNKYDLEKISSLGYIVKRVRRARVLIIDEVSMLAPETLDMVDAVCREVKHSMDSFGGLQVIFAGDFFQLPPIQKMNRETSAQAALIEKLQAVFVYDSPAWVRAKPVVCYFTEQHRQDDAEFLSLLSAIRGNSFGVDHLRQIERCQIEPRSAPPRAPQLYSHNVDVDRVNNDTLAKIAGKQRTFVMDSHGPAALVLSLKKGCLSPETLILKVGAEVMFTKNSVKDGFVNGTLGIVESFDELYQCPVVRTKDGRKITAERMDWTVEEDGRPRAKISQFPLRLAWAITVHKSQGMSLDEAVIDLSKVFEYGQGYVALSRVRRLAGVHLLGWNERAFQVHPAILSQNKFFNESSSAVELVFGKTPADELKKMHDNFIKAAGGAPAEEPEFMEKIKKGTGYDEIRKIHVNAYQPWSADDDKKLCRLFERGAKTMDLAKIFGRKGGAIRSRLVRLGLVE